jgi:hypothetical protein
MDASPSTILSWIRRNPRASLGGKVLVPPKQVWLEEDPASESSVFTIYQVYENLVRRFLKNAFGATAERELDRIRAARNAKGIALSRNPWDLPEVQGLRLRAAYVFRNEQAEESPHLFAHRLASPELNIEPNAPTPIGQAGLGWLRGLVKFATDPRVKVRPLVPWD